MQNLNWVKRTRLVASVAVAGVLVFGAGAALAQDDSAAPLATAPTGADAPQVDPREARIQALEQQLASLANQIADLKSATSSQFRDVRTAQNATTVSLANARPTIATSDGNFKFALRTVVQFDAARYSEDPLTPTTDLGSGTNFRRARLGFDATAFKDWNFSLWGEFGGSGGEAAALNQAYIEYAGWKPKGFVAPIRLRVGAWATPTGLEDATSNTESVFLERAAPAELVRNFAGGDGRSGVGFFANGDHWYASGTLTGAVVGVPTTPEFGEQTGYLARIAFNPFYGPDYDVHIGANINGVIDPADTAAGPTVATALRLRERPEVRVDGTRLVDTGNIASDGLVAYGLEGGASFKNFYVAGEWYKIDVSRPGETAATFDPSFSGWYVQGAWTLTGERHQWNSANGGFRGIRPAKVFDPRKGDWGAFEVAARYSSLDLNDNAGLTLAAAPAGGIRGGDQKITTVGLNWYPNSVIRFLLDYQWINVDKLSAAGANANVDVNVISLRSQFAF